jgi:methyl-accepting chemotaxis protein
MTFKTRITIANSLITIIAVAIIYYIAIKTITFTMETIKFISIVTIFIVILALTIQYLASLKPFSIIHEFEERLKNNTLDERFTKTAFYTALFFPFYFMSVSAAQWYFASIIYFILLYAFSQAGLIIALKTTFAIVSGATIANIFQYFVYQRQTEPLIIRIQEHLEGAEITIKKRIGIFTKIFFSSSLLIFIFLIFARTISNQLMDGALRSNGIESAKLDLAASKIKVDAILSQDLSTEQTALELSKIKLGTYGYVLLMDSSYHDIFNISDNYTSALPLKMLSKRTLYNDPTIDATLIKMPISKELYLVGVYSWADYNDILSRFSDSLNWLLLAVILTLVMVSLYVTLDIYLPVKAIDSAVEKMTKGNFSAMSGLFVEDEAGIVANNIRKTTKDIRSVIKTMKEASSNIVDVSDKMMNSIDLTKENILLLDKEIRNNAEIIASVQSVLNRLTEYIEGLINSINDTIINSDNLMELIDGNKDTFSGLMGSVDSIFKSNDNLLVTIKNILNIIKDNVLAGSGNNREYLKTMNMKNEESIKDIGLTMESLIDNMNRLASEIKTGENNKRKIDAIFHNTLVTVSSLNDNVERIVVDLNKIDLVIDDTNLLAMNSSVISAQAGKAGKGFDVVSDEITKLATVTQTKILEVKNLTELLVKEKDTIKSNIYEKKKFIDNVDSRLNSFKEEINGITGQTSHIRESYGNILKAINNLVSKRENLLKDSMSEKEMYHLIKTKFNYIEESIGDVNKYSDALKDIVENIFKRWGNYTETLAQIPQELSTINGPATTISGYMNVIKTKTSEIHGILDMITDTSRQLNKQLNDLNIRSEIEGISAGINEEPRRYRIL